MSNEINELRQLAGPQVPDVHVSPSVPAASDGLCDISSRETFQNWADSIAVVSICK
jgi:hypothetical protein